MIRMELIDWRIPPSRDWSDVRPAWMNFYKSVTDYSYGVHYADDDIAEQLIAKCLEYGAVWDGKSNSITFYNESDMTLFLLRFS
jgi:hypothetical protein